MYVFPSLKQLEDFKTWQAYDDVEENFCELDGKVQVIFFFFFSITPHPPLHTHTPTHPHGHVSMAMSLFDLSVCLVCPTADSPLELSYVDLILNPERYTGYAGHSPHRIWGAIYHENCFR